MCISQVYAAIGNNIRSFLVLPSEYRYSFSVSVHLTSYHIVSCHAMPYHAVIHYYKPFQIQNYYRLHFFTLLLKTSFFLFLPLCHLCVLWCGGSGGGDVDATIFFFPRIYPLLFSMNEWMLNMLYTANICNALIQRALH